MKQNIIRPSDRGYSANEITKASKPQTLREIFQRPATSPPYGYTDRDEIYSRATRAQYLQFSQDSERSHRSERSEKSKPTEISECSSTLEHPKGGRSKQRVDNSQRFQDSQQTCHSQRSRHSQRSHNSRSRSSIRSHDLMYIEDLDDMSAVEIINEHRRTLGRRPISEGPGVAFVDYFQEAVTPPRSPSFASWPPVSTASTSRQRCCLPLARAKGVLLALVPCVRRERKAEKVHRLRIDRSEDTNELDFDTESFLSYYASVDPVSEKYSDPSNCSIENVSAEYLESERLSRLSNAVNFSLMRPNTC